MNGSRFEYLNVMNEKTQVETERRRESARRGGLSRSEAKTAAARRNGKRGGRPRKYEKQTPPTFSYPGGKARMASMLTEMMPQTGRRYVEPFAGRGNVFWRAAHELDYQEWHINDIRTAPWYEAIRDLGHELQVPKSNRMEYLKRWANYKQGCPYAMMLEPFLTYSGGGYGMGGFGGNKRMAATTPSGYQQSIRMAQYILKATDAKVTGLDWKQAVKVLGADDFVYLDPPYYDCDVRTYGPDDLDFDELVEELRNAPYRWMLSEYDPADIPGCVWGSCTSARIEQPLQRPNGRMRLDKFLNPSDNPSRLFT